VSSRVSRSSDQKRRRSNRCFATSAHICLNPVRSPFFAVASSVYSRTTVQPAERRTREAQVTDSTGFGPFRQSRRGHKWRLSAALPPGPIRILKIRFINDNLAGSRAMFGPVLRVVGEATFSKRDRYSRPMGLKSVGRRQVRAGEAFACNPEHP